MSNETIEIISTPLFWTVSALGSLALGVTSNILTPKVIAAWERRANHKVNENQKAKARRLGEVIIRYGDSNKITQTKLDSLHALLISCVFMLLALVIFSLTPIIVLFFPIGRIIQFVIVLCGIPIVWLALFCMEHGQKLRQITNTVEQRTMALQQFIRDGSKTDLEKNQFLAEWDKKEFGISYDQAASILNDNLCGTVQRIQ